MTRDSAYWAWSLGRDAIAEAKHPSPKLCVFVDGSDHARWWRRGFNGEPFLWEPVS